MLHHLGQRVFPALALEVLIRDARLQEIIGEVTEEALLLAFYAAPTQLKCSPVGKILRSKHLLGGLATPSLDPQPLGPKDMKQRTTNRDMTRAHILGAILPVKQPSSLEQATVCPTIVCIKNLDFLDVHVCPHPIHYSSEPLAENVP